MTTRELIFGVDEGPIRDGFVSPRWVLFTLLVTLNVLDAYLTMLGIRLGVLAEANPLMRNFVGDFWSVALVKMATLGVLAVSLRAARPYWTMMEWVLAAGIGWYIAVVCWNASIVWPHVTT